VCNDDGLCRTHREVSTTWTLRNEPLLRHPLRSRAGQRVRSPHLCQLSKGDQSKRSFNDGQRSCDRVLLCAFRNVSTRLPEQIVWSIQNGSVSSNSGSCSCDLKGSSRSTMYDVTPRPEEESPFILYRACPTSRRHNSCGVKISTKANGPSNKTPFRIGHLPLPRCAANPVLRRLAVNSKFLHEHFDGVFHKLFRKATQASLAVRYAF
jgi:hypothetical protein